MAAAAPALDQWKSSSAEATKRDDSGQLKALAEEVVQVLEHYGLVYEAQLSPDVVGVHRCNRWGAGVKPADVHAKISKIIGMGFSLQATREAMCTEMPPGVEGEEQLHFNKVMVSHANGLLAPIKPDSLEYLSVACSHTNQALRAVKAGCNTEMTDKFVDQGRLSKQLAEHMDKNFGLAMEKGLVWKVIKHEVTTAWPQLPFLLQEAGNLVQGVAREESVLQILLRLRSMALKADLADLDKIAAMAVKNSTVCKDKVQDLSSFILAWGGTDPDDSVLEQVDKANKSLSFSRFVPPAFFGKLAKVTTGATLCKFYIAAVLKAMYACPEKYVTDNEAKLLSHTDVLSINHKNKNIVVAAETMLAKARQIIDENGFDINHSDIILLLAELDIRAVMHVHQKTCSTRKEFAKLSDIGFEFWLSLQALRGEPKLKLRCPWPAPSATPCGVGSSTASTSGGTKKEIRDLTAGVMTEKELESNGIKVSAELVCKTSGEKFTVNNIDRHAAIVKLKGTDRKMTSVPMANLFDEYEATSVKQVVIGAQKVSLRRCMLGCPLNIYIFGACFSKRPPPRCSEFQQFGNVIS